MSNAQVLAALLELLLQDVEDVHGILDKLENEARELLRKQLIGEPLKIGNRALTWAACGV